MTKKTNTQSALTGSLIMDVGEAKLQNLISQARVLVATFQGPSFIIQTVNKTALEIWGKSYEDVINKPLFESSPELEEGLIKIFSDVYTTGDPFIANEMPVQLKRKGKTDTAYFNLIFQPLHDSDNKICGIITIGTEITEALNVRKQLEASEMRFRLALRASGHITFTQDENLKHTWIYNAHPDFKAEDILGKDDYELHEPETAKRITSLKKEVLQSGIAIHREVLMTINGEQSFYEIMIEPIKNDKGKITGITGVAMNITEKVVARKVIEASEERFRILSNTIPHIVWTATPDGKRNFYNQYALDYTGKTLEELYGDGWQKIISPLDLERTLKQWHRSIQTHEDFKIENRWRCHDGSYHWFLSQGIAQKDKDGNITEWVGTNTNIDAQKSFAEELMKAKIQAEAATEIANQAVKSKQQFLSNMSHEIRTPMNSVIGFTNVLLKTDISEKQNEYLQAIKTSGDSLMVLINDILDLAKVDAGKMEFEQKPFELELSISSILEVFAIRIQEKKLRLIKEYDQNIPKVLIGDHLHLRQIILNLVSNAIKFTQTGDITFSVRLVNEDKEMVKIEFAVKDTGIGIEENQFENIFEKFHQIPNPSSSLIEGTGLGLAICKQLVEKQGGTISVKSKINEGSTFSFILSFSKNSFYNFPS